MEGGGVNAVERDGVNAVEGGWCACICIGKF